MEILAYHNARSNDDRDFAFLTHKTGEPVVLVFRTEIPDQDDLAACEWAFHLLNVGHEAFGTPDPAAIEYRARGNRSLSVGDVVSVDGRFYAVASYSWAPIDKPPMVETTAPGTTPIADTALDG